MQYEDDHCGRTFLYHAQITKVKLTTILLHARSIAFLNV